MEGSIVYTNTGFNGTAGVINFNHHTYEIYVCNFNNSTNAIIKLNGIHQVLIPHSPNQSNYLYIRIPGDYTTIECLTANVTLAMFAIG
jgi:hypothetical protein